MRRAVGAALLIASVVSTSAGEPRGLASFEVSGDSIAKPLDGRIGDAERGRSIVIDRRGGNCLICHRVPAPDEPFQGDLGPDLGGIGGRLTEAQIRLRLIDASRLNAETLMPPYHRVEGLARVAKEFDGRPVLTAAEIEDVVAWLVTLK